MSQNNDNINLLLEFSSFANHTTLEEFAAWMGKHATEAHKDNWVLNAYRTLREEPLELFVAFDRGHQALLLRAIAGDTTNRYKIFHSSYEYYVQDLGATAHIAYEIEHECDHGANADGNRGMDKWSVLINDYIIAVNGIDITKYIDKEDFDPDKDDALTDEIIERYKGDHFNI